jgi:hypothetical protein
MRLVKEYEGENLLREFIQLRTYIKIDTMSNSIQLEPAERESEKEEDKVYFVKFANFEEAMQEIFWFTKSIEKNGEVVSIDAILKLSN